MAMEFAKTGLRVFRGSDDSWQPSGARSFLLAHRGPFPGALAVASDRSEN
jgi:hypothetical protein